VVDDAVSRWTPETAFCARYVPYGVAVRNKAHARLRVAATAGARKRRSTVSPEQGERVRLYHGTTVEAAKEIRLEGFRPPDPRRLGRKLCKRYGVSPEILNDSRLDYALWYPQSRFEDEVASFSTRWRVAATAYARKAGSEVRWTLLAIIAEHLVGKDELEAWRGRQAQLWPPAIVTVEGAFAELVTLLEPRAEEAGRAALEAALRAPPNPLPGPGDHWVELRAPIPHELIRSADALAPCRCQVDWLNDRSVCEICPDALT